MKSTIQDKNVDFSNYDMSEPETETYELPYQSQSIRRLDGPFDPFLEPQKEEIQIEEAPRRKLIKIKVKKPVSDRTISKNSYPERRPYTEAPAWRQPIKPLNEESFFESARKSQTEGPVPSWRYPNDGDDKPTTSSITEKSFFNQPRESISDAFERPVSSWRYPKDDDYSKPRSYDKPKSTWRYPDEDDSLSYFDEPEDRYTTKSFSRPTIPTRPPYTPTRAYYQETTKYQTTTPSYVPNYYQTTPKPRTTKATYKPRFQYEEKNVIERRNTDVLQERQTVNNNPNFLDKPFQIPSFFQSNSFNEPSFARFNPPFGVEGMFADFLKTVGDDGSRPFQPPESRTAFGVELNEEPNRYGAFEETEEAKESPRWFVDEYNTESPSLSNGYFSNDYIQDYGLKPKVKEALDKPFYDFKPSTEIYQPPSEKPTVKYEPIDIPQPSYKPIKEPKPSYKPAEPFKPSYQPAEPSKPLYEPIEPSKPSYEPIQPSQPSYKPVEKPKPSYKTPEEPKKSYKPVESKELNYNQLKKPIKLSYKPIKEDRSTYKPPVKETKPYKPANKENHIYQPPKYRPPIQKSSRPEKTATITTPKPTESAVYYKPLDSSDPKNTPGPVYYKPLDEDTTTTTSIYEPPATSTSTEVPLVHTDSVATAPKPPKKKPVSNKQKKVPPPKLKKKPLLRLPKFPKLPKPLALKRRPRPPLKYQPKKPKRPSGPPPKSKPVPRNGKSPQPKGHKNLLHNIKDIVKGHKNFLVHRDGNPLAQSTAVLIPYVLSLL